MATKQNAPQSPIHAETKFHKPARGSSGSRRAPRNQAAHAARTSAEPQSLPLQLGAADMPAGTAAASDDPASMLRLAAENRRLKALVSSLYADIRLAREQLEPIKPDRLSQKDKERFLKGKLTIGSALESVPAELQGLHTADPDDPDETEDEEPQFVECDGCQEEYSELGLEKVSGVAGRYCERCREKWDKGEPPKPHTAQPKGIPSAVAARMAAEDDNPIAGGKCGDFSAKDNMRCTRDWGHAGKHAGLNRAGRPVNEWGDEDEGHDEAPAPKRCAARNQSDPKTNCERARGHAGPHKDSLANTSWLAERSGTAADDDDDAEDAEDPILDGIGNLMVDLEARCEAHVTGLGWELEEVPDDGRSTRRALRITTPVEQTIATVTFPRDQSRAIATDVEKTARANAQLLAAAPDMAALLLAQEGLLADMERVADALEDVDALRKQRLLIRHVLNKAGVTLPAGKAGAA